METPLDKRPADPGQFGRAIRGWLWFRRRGPAVAWPSSASRVPLFGCLKTSASRLGSLVWDGTVIPSDSARLERHPYPEASMGQLFTKVNHRFGTGAGTPTGR